MSVNEHAIGAPSIEEDNPVVIPNDERVNAREPVFENAAFAAIVRANQEPSLESFLGDVLAKGRSE
jgi:hypothetical protein